MRFIAIGRILPERAEVTFTVPPWRHETGTEIRVSCEASQITVVLENWPQDDVVSAYIMADHVAQAIVSAYGFAAGSGYLVEIVQMINDAGDSKTFGVRVDNLMFDPIDAEFIAAEQRARRDVHFRMALADYTQAIVDAWACAALCYRAIEAIKSAFGPGDDEACWLLMHESLDTRRIDIENTVKVFADAIRHGNWRDIHPTNSTQRNAMLLLTRNILHRYLQFRENAHSSNPTSS